MIDHIKDLIPDPKNRRVHTPRNIGMIADGMQVTGAHRSIVIDENNVILAGNGVTEAAAEVGITRVRVIDADGDELIAVRRTGLTDAQKVAVAMYDNRAPQLAEWNTEQIRADLKDGLDFAPFFFPEELKALLATADAKPGLTDPDAVPADRPTEIVRGDLFALGRHRLLCGDCLDPAVVNRLVDPTTPVATLVTSPPYWTGQPYDDKPGEAGVRAFIDRWCQAWASRVRRRIQIQTGHTNNTLIGDTGPLRKILLDGLWADALSQHGWLLRHRRIWGKAGNLGPFTGPVTDLIDESWEVLLTFYRPGHNEGGMERVSNDWAQVGVWTDIRGEHGDGSHPCPYPVALAERMIRLYSVEGDAVADTFAGSGTTLIACEGLGRTCLAMELSPAYCQVIIDRWENFTGGTAVKIEPTA